jgi:hypothetical protein
MKTKAFRIEGLTAAALVALSAVSGVGYADDHGKHRGDFGARVEHLLHSQSDRWFGIEKPLPASAAPTSGDYRTPQQAAADQVALAKGLHASYLTRTAGNHSDMMAFWPSDANATHLITCVEGGREVIGTNVDGSPKYNPSVQRINLATGAVETVLRGMNRCDGIRNTAWGTILVTEETDDGQAYEILNPLAITNETVLDRAAGTISAPDYVVKRNTLPTMAWEGLTVLDSGVVIGGDELRPGSNGADTDGGAVFKFVPASPYTGSTGINDLGQSPLATGTAYAMQVSCVDNKQQYGQGCEVGNAAWVAVNPATARADANANGATGFYRPEDLHRDPVYKGGGVRFCWTNTGNEGARHYAEVMCGVDSAPLTADANQRTVVINRFVEGDTDFNSFDNLAFQPKTGNLYVVEDHHNGDVFACLPDGTDRDIKSDGCIKVLSVKDTSAEPTGFIFSADGSTAYVSIQHSDDGLTPMVDDYRTDDLIRITGFKVKGERRHHRHH